MFSLHWNRSLILAYTITRQKIGLHAYIYGRILVVGFMWRICWTGMGKRLNLGGNKSNVPRAVHLLSGLSELRAVREILFDKVKSDCRKSL